MKLSIYQDTYYEFSGKASDVARQLAFAGIAFVWIFKYQDSNIIRLPVELLIPATFFALTLAFDLLQYIFATAIWGIFQWHMEKTVGGLGKDPDLDTPSWFKLPQLVCLILKLIAVVIGYIFLLQYIFGIWLVN